MKKTLLSALVGLLFASSAGAQTTDTLTVRIKAMRCGDCVHKVNMTLRQLQGIDSVGCNLERRTATIVYNPALTCADSICARLADTKRYKTTPYSPADTIRRGIGLRIDDMFCQNCVNRVVRRLAQQQGVDSVAPHLDKHYVFVRYDANSTCKDSIKQALVDIGFTPVNYYTGNKVAYAYYNIPAEAATAESADKVMTLLEVDDARANPRRHTLAVTYFCEEISAEQLIAEVRKMGIEAVVPPPHECKEQGQP